jgi:hypothetical protein
MFSGKGGLNEENFVDTSILLDVITSLIDAFKQEAIILLLILGLIEQYHKKYQSYIVVLM